MLYEIHCDKFNQQTIRFKETLSVVLGTECADNSIGKSTFLLIVDFVFGGTTYAQKSDISQNIGNHDIFFTFKFNNEIFKFCRNYVEHRFVWKCNEKYERIEKMDLIKYCEWLKEQYKINLPDLSFRNMVGRYMRVYGKENCDENRPLHLISNEKTDLSIYSLIKLFNKYEPIKQMKERANVADAELTAYRKAQNLNFISNINSKQYEQNKKEIEQAKRDILNLSINLDTTLLDLDVVASEEAIELKKQLSRLKRYRAKSQVLLNSFEENASYKFSITNQSLDELKTFFPNIDIKRIEEIENFHKKISTIFKTELKIEKQKIEKEIEMYDIEIRNCDNQLKSLIKNPNLSKIILEKHSRLLKEKEIKENENNAYDKLKNLKNFNKLCTEALKEIENKQLGLIETSINENMKSLNNQIYGGTCNPPRIRFYDSKYVFYTENDTGTGIAYKGLVLFDLSILELTPLPILVHDSIMLKQISDFAIQKIIELYIASNKQVIIALDKQNSYGEQTEKLLNSYSVLKLAKGGNELFGYSWG